MSFHDTRFPSEISYGSSGGPEYATDIVISQSGHEARNINWGQARARYNVAHGVKSNTQLHELIAFFRARKGRAYGFRFKDWSDYQAQGQRIGTGDGARNDFQLIKTYENGGVVETRTITKPVAGSVAIFLDGSPQTLGVDATVDHLTGVVSFVIAPAPDAIIRADFEFDVPVRFDTDRLSATLDAYGTGSWQDIPLIELRG